MKYIANPVEVDAFVITGIGNNLGENFGQEVKVDDGSTRLITPEQMARMTPVVGDYFVIQSDGYIYINPKTVFERKYSQIPTDYPCLRKQIGDFKSTFYGPHKCENCEATIIRQSRDQGGIAYSMPPRGQEVYVVHGCQAPQK
jgi:hypothetical protein